MMQEQGSMAGGREGKAQLALSSCRCAAAVDIRRLPRAREALPKVRRSSAGGAAAGSGADRSRTAADAAAGGAGAPAAARRPPAREQAPRTDPPRAEPSKTEPPVEAPKPEEPAKPPPLLQTTPPNTEGDSKGIAPR
jgi:hypothetical protein